MNKTLILINCKTYPQIQATKSIKFAKSLSSIKSLQYQIALAPTIPTLAYVRQTVSLPLFAQHVDPIENGPHTGHISVDELSALGITGVILNHSERPLPFTIIKKTVELCRKRKLSIVLCASTLAQVQKFAPLLPDYIAYEPAALIGKNISVTDAQPKILRQAHDTVRILSPKTKLLCGAGIHSHSDITHAKAMGYQGVLLSHAIVTAHNPKQALLQLLEMVLV
ncbi:triose-phosphate isomerase [Candidatus Woesearchaeota archaeon]|nr:triose-phosphate isomerase [Candidatus Woesearchaeota archaeon]